MVITDKEFYEVDALYQRCFSSSSIPTAIQAKWRQAQPNGIVTLVEKGEIIGALSYWYLNEDQYIKMKSGQLKEIDLEVSAAEINEIRCAYISEIALLETYRGQGKSSTLLANWITQLMDENQATKSLSILALGYSNSGISILTKLGFHLIKNSDLIFDKMPLYELQSATIHKLAAIHSKFI
jgi:ribosomal protein S18 acetylase RimI-like enzyme